LNGDHAWKRKLRREGKHRSSAVFDGSLIKNNGKKISGSWATGQKVQALISML
jgi:hypothetical protein